MKVLAETRDGMHSNVGNVSALGKHQVSQARGHVDDLLDGGVGQPGAGSQVENTQVLVCLVRGQREESRVVDQFAACQSEFAQSAALGDERGDGLVLNLVALVQVNLENVGAVLGECQDRIVLQLSTVVQLELLGNNVSLVIWKPTDGASTYPLDVPTALRQNDHGLVGDQPAP